MHTICEKRMYIELTENIPQYCKILTGLHFEPCLLSFDYSEHLTVWGSFSSPFPSKKNFDCKYSNPTEQVEIYGPRRRMIPPGKHIFSKRYLYLALYSPTTCRVSLTVDFAKQKEESCSEEESEEEEEESDGSFEDLKAKEHERIKEEMR